MIRAAEVERTREYRSSRTHIMAAAHIIGHMVKVIGCLTQITSGGKLRGYADKESHQWVEMHLHKIIEIWNTHFGDRQAFEENHQKIKDPIV